MDINQIKKLIKLVEGSKVTELEIEEENSRIRITKEVPGANSAAFFGQQPAQYYPAPAAAPAEKPAEQKPEGKTEEQPDDSNLFEVKSPIVGTYYSAPAPDADSYVKVGDHISEGSVLCIVEAMKLMNEIESDVSGTIKKILVDNAKPVEYNQPLFLIELD